MFNRHVRGVTLTNEGEILFQCVEELYKKIDDIVHTIQEENKELQGDIRLAATHGIVNFYLLPFLPGFSELYPKIHLHVIGMDDLPDFDFNEADVSLRPFQVGREDLIQDLILHS